MKEEVAQEKRVQCSCGKTFVIHSSAVNNPCCVGKKLSDAPPLPAVKPLGRKKRNRRSGRQISDLIGAYAI